MADGDQAHNRRRVDPLPGHEQQGPRGSRMQEVFADPDLLTPIWFLLTQCGQTLRNRAFLLRLSLVSHAWKEWSRSNSFWEPIARVRMPLLASPSNALVAATGGSIFAYMAGYGKALREETQVVEDDWCKNVIGHFEIFDAKDGFRMFSACGPIRLDDCDELGHSDDEKEDYNAGIMLRLTGAERREIVGAPFSVNRRSPDGPFEGFVEDFFQFTHTGVHCSRIHVNITLTWVPTGKTVMLWHSARETNFLRHHGYGVHPFWQHFLPEGSLFFHSDDKRLAPAPDPKEDLALDAQVAFYLKPLPSQVPVSGLDELWQFAGGDEENNDDHDSFVRLLFKVADKDQVAGHLRSLFEEESDA